MSTKVDGGKSVETKNMTSDWDGNDDDDNWDDWGDAMDNFHSDESADKKLQQKSMTTNNSVLENTTNNNKRVSSIDSNDNESVNSVSTQEEQQSNAWGSVWKPWGVVSSVLSTATEGLGNITSTVSQGLNQVIGVPDPEEMARINAAEAAKTVDDVKCDKDKPKTVVEEESSATPVFALNLVNGVTTFGSKFLNTGLDTLEGIGKKTMNMLQENDPLLMNKRKMLGLEPTRVNLSEILKEAKNDADQLENTLKEMKIERSKELMRFEIIFENNCGLVHLEALEILSKESDLKLQTLLESVSGKAQTDFKETINEVKELLEMEDLDADGEGDYDGEGLNEKLMTALEDVDLQINFDDIISKWSEILTWLSDVAENATEEEVFNKGLTTLAETCALEMSKLHKIAELLLVKEHHSTANEVDCIVQLCKGFNSHLNGLTNRFAATLNSKGNDAAKAHMTTLFSEMLQATQHIEKAFKLFLPILQIGAV